MWKTKNFRHYRKLIYKTRPFTHFGKPFMGKGLGERAITNN